MGSDVILSLIGAQNLIFSTLYVSCYVYLVIKKRSKDDLFNAGTARLFFFLSLISLAMYLAGFFVEL